MLLLGAPQVMCQINEDYGLGAGTDYDLSGHPWNAVGLPHVPFQCDFSSDESFIGLQTGWSNSVGYFRRAGSSCTWTPRGGVETTNGCVCKNQQNTDLAHADAFILCTGKACGHFLRPFGSPMSLLYIEAWRAHVVPAFVCIIDVIVWRRRGGSVAGQQAGRYLDRRSLAAFPRALVPQHARRAHCPRIHACSPTPYPALWGAFLYS